MTSDDTVSAKSVTMESTTGKHGTSLAEKAAPFQASNTSVLIRTRRSNPYFDEVLVLRIPTLPASLPSLHTPGIGL
jgi:hypothetical protein